MFSKYAGAVALAVAALCGTGTVASGQAATASHALLLRPGVGIGPIRIGETLSVLRKQLPDVRVYADGNRYSVKVDGATIQGGVSARRVVGVLSTSAELVLGTQRLQNRQASEPQTLVRAGWTRSSCLGEHILVYRRDPRTRATTAIVWLRGAPVFAEVVSGLPPTWTRCAGTPTSTS